MLMLVGLLHAADESADAGQETEESVEEQALEETAGKSEPDESRKPRIRRPRKLGDVFKPSEEITADSAITFPVDI